MSNCHWFPKIERYLDGESPDVTAVETHLQQCPDCKKHLHDLKQLRHAVQATTDTPEIQDAQLSTFLAGIQKARTPQPNPFKGWWALASLTAAALIVALATYSLLQPQDSPVNATEEDATATAIEGENVDWHEQDDVMTLWEDKQETEKNAR